jgi:hypothetical protein
MTNSSDVIYALDIGVYNLGEKGQVLSSTTAVWCRVDAGAAEFRSLRYSGTPDQGGILTGETASWRSGRKMEHLAEAIAADLHNGARVALGFEAPMWLPLERAHRSGRLFAPRFEEEKGHEWYLQAGAAATVKAIGLGVMVFSTLLEQYPSLACTTDCSEWQGKTLMLFEAFVAGPYKVVPPELLTKNALNEWDAFVAALRWGATHAGLHTPSYVDPVVLHRARSHRGESLSVWRVACGTANLPGAPTGPCDCDIVALRNS